MRDIAVWIQGIAVVGMILVGIYGWVTAYQIQKHLEKGDDDDVR